jgi:hypothetical protein
MYMLYEHQRALAKGSWWHHAMGRNTSSPYHLNRLLESHQAWQALRASKAWNNAQLQLWQAEAGASGSNTGVTAHSYLQTSSQGHSLDCCDCGLGPALQDAAD